MLGSARAGTRYEVQCATKECGFTTSIGIGGGRMFEEASGYCKKCDQVVAVTWKRETSPKPLPVRFWDSLAGKVREIFICPKCRDRYAKIDDIDDFTHCPKCGKKSLRAKRTLLYD